MARPAPTDRMEDIGTGGSDDDSGDTSDTTDDEPDYSRPAPDERMEDIGTGGGDSDDNVSDTGTPTDRPDVQPDDPRRVDTEPDPDPEPDDSDGGKSRPPPTDRMEDIGTAPSDDGGKSDSGTETDGTDTDTTGSQTNEEIGLEDKDGNAAGGFSTLDDDLSQSELQTLREEGFEGLSDSAKQTVQSEFQEDVENVGLPAEELTPVIIGDQLRVFEGEVSESDLRQEQARMLESDIVGGYNTPIDRDDVRITEGEGDVLSAEFTEQGQEEALARELGVGTEDIRATDDGFEATTAKGAATRFPGLDAGDIRLTDNGQVEAVSTEAQQTFEMQGIESELRREYPDASSYSIDFEGGMWDVEVETQSGETVNLSYRSETAGAVGFEGTPIRPPVGMDDPRRPGVDFQPVASPKDDIISQIEADTGAELDEDDVTVQRVTEDGETRFQGTLTESGQTKVEVATGQRPEGAEAFTEATESGGFLSEEREANLAERSAEFQESVEGISEGVVDFFDIDSGLTEDAGLTDESGLSPQQRTFSGAISGTLGFLDPFQAAKTGETGVEIAQSLADGEIDYEEFAASTKAVAAFTAREASEAFKESPQRVGGQLLGGAGAGFAVGAASPLRFSKIKIPDTEGGTQTIRTAQLGFPGGTRKTLTPGAKQIKTRPTKFQTPTKNIAGTRGFKPTVGTPKADIDTVDFSKLGTRADDAFEPTGQLETQVFRKSFDARGDATTAQRIGAVRDLMESGKKSRSKASLEITSAEDIAKRVETVPDAEAGRVAAKLQETDASIFGSAATEAQLPGFRKGVLEKPAPKDIDVVVPDEAAKAELKAFESELDADIFDIKLQEDVPGRAAGGQPIKFGQRSQSMLETEEGIPVNPASEELLRKAGASGFFRGTDAPEVGEFDIGPQPVRPGRLSTRQKDVLDAVAMGEELLGEEAKSVRQFRSAFEDVEGVGPTQGAITLRDRLQINRFLDDTRAQGGMGATTRGTRDVDVDTGDAEDVIRRFDDAGDAGTSPTRTTDLETTRPSAAAAAGLGAGGSQVNIDSPGASPSGEDFMSPTTDIALDPSIGSPSGVGDSTGMSPVGGTSFESPVGGVTDFDPSPVGLDIPTITSPTGGPSGGGGSPGSPTSGGGPGGSPGGGGVVPPFEGGPTKPTKRPDEDDREFDEQTFSTGEFAEKFESNVATPEEVLTANYGAGVLEDDET